jgi:Uma2 family endonuclease
MERKAEFRSEYVNGEIIAMAGASREHNRITMNLGSRLDGQLDGSACEPFAADMRVRVSPSRYTYPDVVVACDPQFEDTSLDTLRNPIVIIEVLSPSTSGDDRGWKFAHYRLNPTLTDYVLISQNEPLVEHYVRQNEGQWVLTILNGLEAVLRLPSITCELPLSVIYRRVEFTPETLMPGQSSGGIIG